MGRMDDYFNKRQAEAVPAAGVPITFSKTQVREAVQAILKAAVDTVAKSSASKDQLAIFPAVVGQVKSRVQALRATSGFLAEIADMLEADDQPATLSAAPPLETPEKSGTAPSEKAAGAVTFTRDAVGNVTRSDDAASLDEIKKSLRSGGRPAFSS